MALEFRMSMGGGDCLLSGDPSARLPAYKKLKSNLHIETFNDSLWEHLTLKQEGCITSDK